MSIRIFLAALAVLCLGYSSAEAQSISSYISSAPLNEPSGLVIDKAGNLYVANAIGPGGVGATVIRVTPGGAVSTVLTMQGNNPLSSYVGNGNGLALDSAGTLYVADSGNNEILRVAGDGTVSTFVDASQGLSFPLALAFDGQGNLFVVNEASNSISKVTPDGSVSTFVPNGAGLAAPNSLAIDAKGNLYVGNFTPTFSPGGLDLKVSKVTPAGTVTTFFDGAQCFCAPTGLALDANGNLFVASLFAITKVTPAGSATQFVQSEAIGTATGLAFDTQGNLVTTDLANNALHRIAPDGTVTTVLQSSMAGPFFAAFDPSGNLYFTTADGSVDKATPQGDVSTFVPAAKLNGPTGIAVDASGNVYIANTANSTIAKATPAGNLSLFVPPGVGLVSPTALAFGPSGNLYVVNALNKIQNGIVLNDAISEVLPDGGVVGLLHGQIGLTPQGLAVGSDGNLYASALTPSGNQILRVTPSGTFTVFASGSALNNMVGLAFDSAGNLYGANQGNATVVKFAPSGTASTLISASAGSGLPHLVAPYGTLFDRAGRLYVTDPGSNTIFRADFGASPLAAAILPGSRSVQTGKPATVFATLLNTSGTALDGCGAALLPNAPSALSMSFQTTDPATNALNGTSDTPVGIPANSFQTFLLSFTATGALSAPDLAPAFTCGGVSAAPSTVGVDTVDLQFSTTPVADIIAIAATASGDGTVHVADGAGAFAVATVDAGAAGNLTVTADTGAATLPVALTICQTSATGQCLAPPAASLPVAFAANATPTFSVFVTASGSIPFAPGTSRIFVRFKDASGVAHGSTSEAVTTN